MTSYYLKLVSSVIILVWCVVLRDVQLAGSCKRVDHFFADAGRIARLPNHFQIVSAFRPFYVTVLIVCHKVHSAQFFGRIPKSLLCICRAAASSSTFSACLSCGKDRDPEMFSSECNLVVCRWLEYGSFLCFLF
jgi:hypothetical protein